VADVRRVGGGAHTSVVRPIYGKGDRVLAEMSFGYCDVTVEGCEIKYGPVL
jgi:hypothetical protein